MEARGRRKEQARGLMGLGTWEPKKVSLSPE